MKMIHTTKLLAISSILSVSLLQVASAHPGRTAADGCHYCRTNCDTWGVPWNERHCHGHSNTNEHSHLLTAARYPTTLSHKTDRLDGKTGNQASLKSKRILSSPF